jgi:hypothetical protein
MPSIAASLALALREGSNHEHAKTYKEAYASKVLVTEKETECRGNEEGQRRAQL